MRSYLLLVCALYIDLYVSSNIIAAEEATYENALNHFLVADELKENFVVNALWCAHAYKKLGNTKKAKQWYQKALRMKQESHSDKQSAKEARKLLSKL